MAPEHPYRESRFWWLYVACSSENELSKSKSVRGSKCVSKCTLRLWDEVCNYHRENKIYDHILRVGLPILKVHAVESKQPRTTRFARGAWPRPLAQTKQVVRECLVLSHGSLDITISVSFGDGLTLIVSLFSFSNSKFNLDKLFLSIQTNWH